MKKKVIVVEPPNEENIDKQLSHNCFKMKPRIVMEDNFNYSLSSQPIKEKDSKNISEIFQNKQNILLLSEMLTNNINDILHKSLIIKGLPGSGKFTFLKTCLQHHGYTITLFDNEFDDTGGNTFSNLLRSISSVGIDSFFNNSEKRAIVIKNYDNILTKIQQQDLFEFLIKNTKEVVENKKRKRKEVMSSLNISPVFLLTNTNKPKYTRCIRVIDIELPSLDDLIILGRKINEKLSDNELSEIFKYSNGDIRQFINSVEFLNISGEKISLTNPQNTLEFIRKDIELDIQTKLKLMSQEDVDINKKLLMSSIYTNALVHENYLNSSTDQLSLETSSLISDRLTLCDVFYKDIVENQLWDDINLLNHYYTSGTVFPLSKLSLNVLRQPLNTRRQDYINFKVLQESVYAMRYIDQKYLEKTNLSSNLSSKQIRIISKIFKKEKEKEMNSSDESEGSDESEEVY